MVDVTVCSATAIVVHRRARADLDIMPFKIRSLHQTAVKQHA